MPLPDHTANGHQRKLNATAYSHFIAALVAGPKTKMQLHEACGMSELLVLRLIKQMRVRGQTQRKGFNAVLHISGWHPDRRGHMTIREYALGPGQDAEQPIMPRDEIVRRYLRNRKMKEQK